MTELKAPTYARVAITGASGFVGRHLVPKLAASRYSLVTLSRSGTKSTNVRDVVLPDYSDASALRAALVGVESVVHLAARAHQRSSGGVESDERLFLEANVDSALAVARACMNARVRRLIFLSSIGVHGSRTHGQPFTEADVPQPEDLYAASKLQAELEIRRALAGSATQLVVLRPPLVYGPGAPGNFGRLLRTIRKLPLVPLGGLHRQRSLIHIDNLCDAIERAIWHPQAVGQSFVLCDGEDVTIAQIARELVKGIGRSEDCVINVPEGWLRGAASALGQGAMFNKLAGELRVDASAFRVATGWHPPLRALDALRATAAASREDSSQPRHLA